MDRGDPGSSGNLAGVIELLERERAALTFDEVARLDRRLARLSAPRRRRSRLAAVLCLAFGLLFTTAGTGLAISGLASSGTSQHAQYPDRPTGPTDSVSPQSAPSSAPTGGGTAPESDRSSPDSLSDLRAAPAASPGAGLTTAETRGDLPFTGFASIPILVAGIALMLTGLALRRGTRDSR